MSQWHGRVVNPCKVKAHAVVAHEYLRDPAPMIPGGRCRHCGQHGGYHERPFEQLRECLQRPLEQPPGAVEVLVYGGFNFLWPAMVGHVQQNSLSSSDDVPFLSLPLTQAGDSPNGRMVDLFHKGRFGLLWRKNTMGRCKCHPCFPAGSLRSVLIILKICICLNRHRREGVFELTGQL